MQMLAWPDLAKLLRSGVSQHRMMQLQAVKMWGFTELAAYQQSSLMHEGEQVTYSKYCTEPFLVYALGTRKHYLLLKAASLYTSTFLADGGTAGCVLRGTPAYGRLSSAGIQELSQAF